jgi:hypothetical protein
MPDFSGDAIVVASFGFGGCRVAYDGFPFLDEASTADAGAIRARACAHVRISREHFATAIATGSGPRHIRESGIPGDSHGSDARHASNLHSPIHG